MAKAAIVAAFSESEPPKKKATGRPFVKGQSGNPSGKPKANREITEMCREAGPDIIKRLIQIAQSGDEEYALPAMKELLNRGYGKSENISSIKIESGENLTDDELTARIAELEAKLGSA